MEKEQTQGRLQFQRKRLNISCLLFCYHLFFELTFGPSFFFVFFISEPGSLSPGVIHFLITSALNSNQSFQVSCWRVLHLWPVLHARLTLVCARLAVWWRKHHAVGSKHDSVKCLHYRRTRRINSCVCVLPVQMCMRACL